jgi:hypothetical protein
MAQIPRSNGDAGGVANYDVPQYVNGAAVGVGVTINPQGPALGYIGIDFGADLTDAEFQTGGPIEAVIRTIQQLATVATYEVQAVQGTAVRASKFALYPAGQVTAAFATALQADIRALGTVDGYDLTGATVAVTTFGG